MIVELLHKGKVKRVYQDPDEEKKVIIEFTDDITAGDGQKKETLESKGNLTCDLSQFLFSYLNKMGIATHFIRRLEGPKISCHKVKIIPIEVVCRNIAAGSFCRRYGIEKGKELETPLIEFFLKKDELGDPLIVEDAAVLLGHATHMQLEFMKAVTLSVNFYLKELFSQVQLRFIDFKLEFGITDENEILLADEISGDTVRVWDNRSTSLDKDIFRNDSGNVLDAYKDLLERIQQSDQDNISKRIETLYVKIMPKRGIKNPPGEVAQKALFRLGFVSAKEVRAGKIYEIQLDRPITSKLLKQLDLMNVKLLSNPIAETRKVGLQ